MTDHDHDHDRDRERREAIIKLMAHTEALMPPRQTQLGHLDRHRHLCAALAVAYSQHQINDLRGEP